MITKYLNYKEELILEQVYQSILESKIVYSDRFNKVLSKIDSPISNDLKEIEAKDIDVNFNFFDISKDNENVITFTPDRIANQLISEKKHTVKYTGGNGGWLTNNPVANANIFEQLGYIPKTKEVYAPSRNEIGEIISTIKSDKTQKVWCYVRFVGGEGVYNREKLEDFNDEKNQFIFTRNRQEIRIGRIIRALLTANNITGHTDADVEKFVNQFRATIHVMNDVFSRFRIVEGDELGFWYHRKNYLDPHRGSLGSSCQAVGNLDWLEIYIKNPETVKLLILMAEDNDNKIVGRALLWKLIDGSTLMDRIYSMKDSDANIFVEYAKVNNWYSVNGGDWDKTYVAYVKPIEFDQYPSVDTMNNWDPSTGKISNKSFKGSKYIVWSENGDEDDWDDDDDY